MNHVAVKLERISLWAHHGMEESEARNGGPFEIDVELAYPEPVNPTEDSIVGRPDYAAIAALVKETFLGRRFTVIEPLATLIAEKILDRFSMVREVAVAIRKLRPVMPILLDHVEVAVTRTRRQ